MRTLPLLAGTLASALAPPAFAGFTVSQITIRGSANVVATGLNSRGDVTGNVYDARHGWLPFVLAGGKVTILPKKAGYSAFKPYRGYPWATSINDSGAVAGFIYQSLADTYYAVLFAAGRYHKFFHCALAGYPFNAAPPAWPGINNSFYMFFDYRAGATYSGVVIRPRAGDWSTSGCDHLNYVTSVNDAGLAAGFCSNFTPGNSVVYTENLKTGQVTQLAPAGAQQTTGGYVNNQGAVAGTFQDSNGADHGFIWQSGAYTTLDGPGTSGGLSIYGMNDSGRAVGEDTDPVTQQPRIDYYNGSTIVAMPVPAAGSQSTLSINARNTILYTTSGTFPATSYLITCTGASC